MTEKSADSDFLRHILSNIRDLTDEAGLPAGQPPLIATPTPVAVSTEQAAALLAVSSKTLSDYIASGQLRTFRMGRRILVRLTTLEDFAQALENADTVLAEANHPNIYA